MSAEASAYTGLNLVAHPRGNGPGLDCRYALQVLDMYVPRILAKNIRIDLPTAEHELGVAQLAAEALPPELYENKSLDGVDYREVAAVCGGLHDSGKYGRRIQQRLKEEGDFGPEVRAWVRSEHCRKGEARVGRYQRWGRIPAERLPAVGLARPVASRHHSPVPEDYYRLPRAQATAWAMTYLVKRCDVLHAVWYDQSDRRKYQSQREGFAQDQARPPEVVLGIVYKECGRLPLIIDGVEIDIDKQLNYRLGLTA